MPHFGIVGLLAVGLTWRQSSAADSDKLSYHMDAARSGWNRHEAILSPSSVSRGPLGLLWETPTLDYAEGTPPRLFASPLYASAVDVLAAPGPRSRLSLVYVVSSTGFAYAFSAVANGSVAAGALIWRRPLTSTPCTHGTMGNLSTPIIDRREQRLYVTSCEGASHWWAHALDLRDGTEMKGWPVSIDARAVNAPGINRNGSTQFRDQDAHIQRGALALSRQADRLYITFGFDASSGWIVAVDTRTPRVASAFSTTPVTDEIQGGMWSSSGPSLDSRGRIYIATGASSTQMLRHAGIAGVYPNSAHSWGQSILQLTDDATHGFSLLGTYTPFNYCQTAANDIDLGSSGTLVFDLTARNTATTHLLALGGGKQGNAYLLNRERMPGGTLQRHACGDGAADDRSLLSPDTQPQFGSLGPLNVFGPYDDQGGSFDQARSRSTAAFFEGPTGEAFLFVTGSAKRSSTSSVSEPPGLVKLKVVQDTTNAYLRVDAQEKSQTFQNPGSPVVTSLGHEQGIVWVLDTNAPRSATLYGRHAAQPTLYAFDAGDLRLLWKSAAGDLYTGGKYNEPTIADGVVYVGTDRLQAFGLASATGHAAGTAAAQSRKGPAMTAQVGLTMNPADLRPVLEQGGSLVLPGTYRDFELHLTYRVSGIGALTLEFRRPMRTGTLGMRHGYTTRIGSLGSADCFTLRESGSSSALLADPSERTDVYLRAAQPHREVLGLVNEADAIEGALRPYPEWNDYVLLVSGNRFAQAINGRLINDTTDNDFEGRSDVGQIALQIGDAARSQIDIASMRVLPATSSRRWLQDYVSRPQPLPANFSAQQRRQLQSGQAIFRQRCAACHEDTHSGAPPRDSLGQYPVGRITDVLTNGLMREMATGLDDNDKRAVAEYLTAESTDTL